MALRTPGELVIEGVCNALHGDIINGRAETARGDDDIVRLRQGPQLCRNGRHLVWQYGHLSHPHHQPSAGSLYKDSSPLTSWQVT